MVLGCGYQITKKTVLTEAVKAKLEIVEQEGRDSHTKQKKNRILIKERVKCASTIWAGTGFT